MSIEAIKEKARRHEQKEEWHAARDLYMQAIHRLDADEELDISLYNRVGDLEVRMGEVDDAVEHYEEAVDLYMESELPNNAIAICKKVIRNLPDRTTIYLKMGKIRAHQGFVTDARQNFLRYAEMMQDRGDIESALNALVEFVDLVPEDLEIRLALADQLAQHDRAGEAVDQLREARRRLVLEGRNDEAADVEEKLQELAPDEPLVDAEAILSSGPDLEAVGDENEDAFSALAGMTPDYGPGHADVHEEQEEEIEGDFGEIESGGDAEEEAEPAAETEVEEAMEEAASSFSVESEEDEGREDEEEEEEGAALPTFGFGSDEDEGQEEAEAATAPSGPAHEEEDEGPPLPTYGFGGEEEDREEVEAPESEEAREEAMEEAAGSGDWLDSVDEGVDGGGVEAPPAEEDPRELRSRAEELLEAGEETEGERVLARAHEGFADQGEMEAAIEALQLLMERRPEDVELRQRQVEYAYRAADAGVLASAFMDLADSLRRTGDEGKARAVYQQVLDEDPDHEAARAALAELEGEAEAVAADREEVASSEEYVDLGSLVLDEEEEEKSTRFVVAAEAPSGDEEADFAKMLSQFKDKVAENVGTDDVAAHYDLGTAYKEMGLVDEAIGEFQAALRAARDHLPTYEMLGQCFLEKGQPEMAARTLRKAIDARPDVVEDELLGIFYFLGRSHEDMDDIDQALEYYEKVFELDINFMDVTERLRDLR